MEILGLYAPYDHILFRISKKNCFNLMVVLCRIMCYNSHISIQLYEVHMYTNRTSKEWVDLYCPGVILYHDKINSIWNILRKVDIDNAELIARSTLAEEYAWDNAVREVCPYNVCLEYEYL